MTSLKISSAPEEDETDAEMNERTVLRSIRLPKYIDMVLMDGARAESVSVNTLVVNVLKSFNSFYQPAQKFDVMSVDSQALKELISSMSVESLKKLATELGSRVPEASILFWYGRVNEKTFMKWVQLLGKYYRWGEFGYSSEGGDTMLLVHHRLGSKWSAFLSAYLTSAAQATLGVHARAEAKADVLKLVIPRKTTTTQ